MINEAERQALGVARWLARMGMPMFLARPDPDHWSGTGYGLPSGWQKAQADPAVVDAWEPGMALCGVTGVLFDLVDVDPRNGAPEGVQAWMPQPYGIARTPSGGVHYFVAPLGVASRDGVAPGIDVKSGQPDGRGRGFAFLAPTVRLSKVDGQPYQYQWQQMPYYGDGIEADHTGDQIKRRIEELRSATRSADGPPRRLPRSVARAEWDRAYARLVADLRDWSARGWGGEAHAGLLAATTHLARLSPENAAEAFSAAFHAAGLEPDQADLTKLDSAIENAVPDVVVDDADMPPQELFWAGAQVPVDDPGGGDAGPQGAPSGEHARRGGFNFLTEEELDSIPAPDPLVGGMLWQSTVARMFGPSTVGKTWVALDLAAHVALGQPWQGRAVEQGAVVYVAAEGAPSISPRLSAWRSYHNAPRTGVLTWPEPVMIGGPTWGDFVLALADTGPKLTIFDTQAAMMVGRKESDNDDMNDVIRQLRRLAEHVGCCVLLVHHNGWAEEDRARGASSTYAGLDTELQLQEGKAEREVFLVQRKQRYAERDKPMRIRLKPHAGQLVVVGPGEQPEDFFSGSRALERLQNAERVYKALVAMGADANASAERAYQPKLRETLSFATKDLVRTVARVYKHRAGLDVDLTPEEHEWHARWPSG